MPEIVEITERLLSDTGGWQALKEGRGLWESGKVSAPTYDPPILRGTVKDGIKEYRAGLRIVTRTNIENLCSCRISRERGIVCAHSLAVGLAHLKAVSPTTLPPTPAALAAPPQPPLPTGPLFSETTGTEATLHVVIAPDLRARYERNAVVMGIEFETAGKRLLAHALNPKSTYRVSPQDLPAITAIRLVSHGEVPGMLTLDQPSARSVLTALRGHPRVSLGRAKPTGVDSLLAMLPAPAQHEPPTNPDSVPPGIPEFTLHLEGSLNHLGATLKVRYGDHQFASGESREFSRYRMEDASGETHWRSRNLPAEQEALDRLRSAGFQQSPGKGEMVLKGERLTLGFLASVLPRLRSVWKVELGTRFTNITETISPVRPRVEIQGSGENWFELSVSLGTPDGQTFSSAEIQRLLQMGQSHIRMKNGNVALFDPGMLDELGLALADCDPRQLQPGRYRVNRAHAGYLDAVLGEGVSMNGDAEWKRWTRQQLAPDSIAPTSLGPLDAILRPYQKYGVYWMQFLARNGFGGILADEMGLGKTLQALAFVSGLGAGPSLLVCPSSLVQNWAREAAKFTPDLKILVLEGADRHAKMPLISDAGLAITSYPLLRRDAERYEAFQFRAIILDEAQHIKNPETQNAQAAASVRGEHRIVLTGTPLENSVRDLWSIMNFAMPGYLGSQADFKERYEQPIVQGIDAGAVKSRLAKRIRPFLLRRTKREVYKELPEKIEQVLYCELTSAQAELYQKLLSESRRQINEVAEGANQNKSRMLMLTALLRLRQACCDLRLLGTPELPQAKSSAKLELQDELLREAIDGGHRVLIFSQFVSMLKIQKSAMEAAGIAYCYLDGQTKDRMAVVDLFQGDSSIPVFLISLKAGGVGLNLTGADTVVHFDPWWNPAVEAQATDRAHRIGQEKVVTSYKLITRGTVEEKILKLQQSKRGLMEAIESEEPVMGGLTTEEIQGLLE